MDYVKGIAGGIKRRILGSQEDDAAEEANDLNHAHLPELPAYPWGSTSASKQRRTASIDLTNEPFEAHLLPETKQPRFQDRPHDDKRRKLDSTKAPNPANGYQGPSASMKKPGAGMGVRPMNTLYGNALPFGTNPAHGRKKTTTYSALHRNSKLIGAERHGGQQAWLERNPDHTAATQSTRDASHAPPPKRRKTENLDAAPRETIELVDSEGDEIPSVASARQTPPPRQRSYVSSRSPDSATSRHSGRSSNRASQPVSEFLTTSGLIAPKRARPRRKGVNGQDVSRRASQPEVLFLGAGSQSQAQPIDIYRDEMNSSNPTNAAILKSSTQGGKHNSVPNESQHVDGRVTSNHFKPHNSKMRINESTRAEATAEEDYDRIARNLTRRPGSSKNLRDFQHAEYEPEAQNDPVQGSEDELSQPNAPKMKPRKSPVKPISAKRTSAKQRSTAGKCYQLGYARSYDFGPDWMYFTLEHTGDDKKFRIHGHDTDENITFLKMLDLASVNKVQSDNVRRMRLTGGFKDGNKYWCDLTFTNPLDFNEFRSQFIDPEVGSQRTASKDEMQKLFNLPFKKNEKIGTMPMVNEQSLSGQTPNELGRTPGNRLITGLATSSKESDNATSRKPQAATRPPARAVRATRATAPIHDREIIEEEEPERYSVTHGLGKRWAKPLDYSVDSGFLKRRKATIEYDDLEKLDEGQMLNDSIMTFYMLYLYDTLKVSIDRVYFFNTHFFPTLTKKVKGQDGVNYDGVKSWTKRDDVFSYDYLVVPMHEDLHWYLGIICNVNNIRRKPEHQAPQEDSQELNHGPVSLRASDLPTTSTNDISSTVPSNIVARTNAPDDATDTKNIDTDDVNLFEEEKELNLIDRNAETADGDEQLLDEQRKAGEQTIEDGASMAKVSPAAPEVASSTLASGKARQASKKKNNHRPLSRDPDKPVIMMLDSLGQSRTVATRALRQWLEAEGRDKRGLDVEIDNRGHYPKGSQIPTQANYSDCGLYVLGYLRKFFANPDEFTKKLLRSQMSAESDWPDMDPSKMREDIRNLIFALNAARNGARKEAHKAKKTANGKDVSSSSTKTGFKEVSPAVEQTNAVKTQPIAAAPPAPTFTKPERTLEAAAAKTAIAPTDAPRLGSPFEPKSSFEEVTSPITEAAQKEDTAGASSTARDSPTASAKTLILLRHSSSNLTKSPEVRVPATPHINLSTYELYDGASDGSEQPTQQTADLISTLQNRDSIDKGDGKLRMPSAQADKVGSPSRLSRERPTPSSPLHSRTRSGSHDHPIPVDDSQDLDVPVRKQSQPARKPSTEIIELGWSHESVRGSARHINRHAQSSPIRQQGVRQQVFNRDDSIREVDGREWENSDVAHALKRSLVDEGERLGRERELEAPTEDVFDARAAYLQSSHTVQEVSETQDSQPMDLDKDDRVIPESPAQRRSSLSSDVMMMDQWS